MDQAAVNYRPVPFFGVTTPSPKKFIYYKNHQYHVRHKNTNIKLISQINTAFAHIFRG